MQQSGVPRPFAVGAHTLFHPAAPPNTQSRNRRSVDLIRTRPITAIGQQVSALDADSVVAVSCVDRLVVVRYLGADSAQLKRVFSQLWQLARPDVIKRAPCPPGIWRT